MMREIVAVISLTMAAVCAFARSPQTAPAAPTSPDADLTIHYKGPGVTAPDLLSINGRFDAIEQCKKLDGEVKLLIAVDRNGATQIIMILSSQDHDLESMAKHVLELDRFSPGALDGAPAVVAVVDDMMLHACWMEKKDEKGKKQSYLQLASNPEQVFELVETPPGALTTLAPRSEAGAWSPSQTLYHIGNGVSPPELIHQVDPNPTDPHKKGICMIDIIIDSLGIPQAPHIVRSLGPVEDESALDAVKQFRFKPAKKNGVPVPVKITVLVNVN